MNSPPTACASPASEPGAWHIRNIPCPRPGCGRMYSSNSSLRNHLRRKHKGILDMESPTTASVIPAVTSPQERYGIFPIPRMTSSMPDMAGRPFPAESRALARIFDSNYEAGGMENRLAEYQRRRTMPISTSRSTGDMRLVTHLHNSSGTTTPATTPRRGRNMERERYFERGSGQDGHMELTRSLSEPGRRWPKQGYETEHRGSEEEEALHRSAAAIAAMFPPAHHVHHQQWSLTTPPTTMKRVEPVPEEPMHEAPSFATTQPHQRPHWEQQGAPTRTHAMPPVRTAPAGLSMHMDDVRGQGYGIQERSHGNEFMPIRPASAHAADHQNHYHHYQHGQHVTNEQPHAHTPMPEPVAVLDETLKKTHLDSSAKKFSIQHLLGISA